MRSRQNVPRNIIPELGKVADDDLKAARPEARDVFDDDRSWTEDVDDAPVLAPESGSEAVLDACATSGDADVLAGESSGDDVDSGKRDR